MSSDTSELKVLEEIRPFPKAQPRQTKPSGRKKRKSAILTDSPTFNALVQEKENSLAKKKKSGTTAPQNQNTKALSSRTGLKKARSLKPSQTAPATAARKKNVSKQGKRAKPDLPGNENSSEDDASCLVCHGKFSDSQPGEEWFQCTSCANWAHDICALLDTSFICDPCLKNKPISQVMAN